MAGGTMSDSDKVFFKDGYTLALESSSDGMTRQAVLHCTRQAQDAIDDLVNALTAEAERQHVTLDCKKGCAHCCHQPIFATSHEIYFLWEFIQLNMSAEKQQQILQRAFNNYQKRGRMQESQLLASKLPCPLLENGACSVYPGRPLTCRIYLSMSADSCKQFLNHPNDEHSYPQLFEFPLRAGRMLNEGINKGLTTSGLPGKEVLIEEGLLLAHNNGESTNGMELSNLPVFK